MTEDGNGHSAHDPDRMEEYFKQPEGAKVLEDEMEDHLRLMRGAILAVAQEHKIESKKILGMLPVLMTETLLAAAPRITEVEVAFYRDFWQLCGDSIEVIWEEGRE